MLIRKLLVQCAGACAGGLLFASSLSGIASAQALITDDIAQDIKEQFGASGKLYFKGQLGTDWCFNVETERGYNWWYYNLGDGKGLIPRLVVNTARIQATYMDLAKDGVTETYRKYASVILGIDPAGANLPTAKSFSMEAAPTNLLPVPKEAWKKFDEKLGPRTASPNQVLQEPASTNCQSFSMFLQAYALPYLVTKVSSTGTRDVDSLVYKSARYWMFNGRGHAVLNVGSYAITLTDPDTGASYSVQLVVGYGGGAGP